jgi:pantetheine-phosphate adenylyltransferase
MKIAIYPGSFDPITFGHIDIVERACALFDKVILGVAESESKKPLFEVPERIELIETIFQDNPKIEVLGYSKKLTVDLARENNAIAVIRGLRAVADFEYEFQLATMNRSLAPDIESIFFTPKDTLIYVSSSLVKEIAQFGGDVSRFVTPNVKSALLEKLSSQV